MRTEALLTSMDAPLGRAVGNANEVIESIETLKGPRPDGSRGAVGARWRRACSCSPARASDDADAERAGPRGAHERRRRSRSSATIIEAQGGDPRVIDDYARLPQPPHREPWPAPRDGRRRPDWTPS